MSLPVGKWSVNGNGFEGILNIKSVDKKGVLTGTIFNQPIEGFWDDTSKKITFMRIIAADKPSTLQIYTGYLFQTPNRPAPGQDTTFTLTGSFEAFAGTGAVAERILYGWLASIEVIG